MILFTAAALSQDAADEHKLLKGIWPAAAAELSEDPLDEATPRTMKLVIEGTSMPSRIPS